MTLTDQPVTSTVDPDAAAQNRKRWIGLATWGALIVALMVVMLVITTALTSPRQSRETLDPEGTSQAGARALAEILRQQGVDVTITLSHEDAVAALAPGDTLAMADPYALTDDGVAELVDGADRVVFLSLSSRILSQFDLGSYATTATAGSTAAECSVEEFSRTGEIAPSTLMTPASGTVGCYPGSDGSAAVLMRDDDGQQLAAIDGVRLFNNAALADDGNAAVALALLAQSDHLVWYIPNPSDSDFEGASVESLGSLTPDWVTPVMVLLLLAAITMGVARGRRFGPLVTETLPVTVRASETMIGRARLTARAGASEHAARSLREGSRRRLAIRLGLSAHAAAGEVADAASDRLRVQRGALHALLTGPLPTTDTALIDISRRLAELEKAVDAAVRQERTTP